MRDGTARRAVRSLLRRTNERLRHDCNDHLPGDAVRSTATGGQRLTATTPAEVLVWEMHAALGG